MGGGSPWLLRKLIVIIMDSSWGGIWELFPGWPKLVNPLLASAIWFQDVLYPRRPKFQIPSSGLPSFLEEKGS